MRVRLALILGLCALGIESLVFADSMQRYQVVAKKPFDRSNFTQGLTIHDGKLWVSSGLYGQSKVSRYQWPSMTLEQSKRLPSRFFAEGLTFVEGRLLLLTWRSGVILELDPETLATIRVFPIETEGWGMTSHKDTIWISDGTDRLWRGKVGQELTPVSVALNGRAIDRLNELEWIDGEIWANQWQSDQILRIDPTTGSINSIIDMRGLLPANQRRYDTDVLNGIAQNPETGEVWVTGKRWPQLFNIRVVD